jgi:hypothetical protein
MLLCAAFWLGGAPALALGPRAPFEPPRAASAAASGGASARDTANLPTSTAGLAGVRLGRSGSAALIDGQWWPEGSLPRGARLVSVHRGQVQLRHADGALETLFLHPAAQAVAVRAPHTPAPTPAP